jgi:hypothetical protein
MKSKNANDETEVVEPKASEPQNVVATSTESEKNKKIGKAKKVKSKISVFEIPPHFSNALREVYQVNPSNFEPDKKTKGKKQSVSNSELIIGFDTEYRSKQVVFTRDEIKQGLAKSEILSYQFHCIYNDTKTWSGICCPEKDQRIDIGTFIIFALAKGIQQKLIKKIPRKVILVGHFTRADVPAFEDFKSLTTSISGIRNTFISLDIPINLEIQFPRSENITISIMLRDTMLLSPGTSKSLSAVGDLVERPKIKLSEDPKEDKELKINMDKLRDDNWDLFKSYALNDAIICAEYLNLVNKLAKSVTGESKSPATLTSIGVKLLINSWEQKSNLKKRDVLGKEEVSERKWNKKLNRYQKNYTEVFLEEANWHLDFITETYHGGRNEQLWFGPCYEGDWVDYDLSSAYPTAMALIGLPDWKSIENTFEIDKFTPTTLGFACVDFEFPPEIRYPTLPVRTENGLIFPLKGRSYCSAPEIVVARELGCKMTPRRGVIIPTNNSIKVFGDFIKDAIQKRSQYPKKSFHSLFWKEVSNSTYGKTAQGLRKKRVYDSRDREMKDLPESKITNPFFASFITSFVRALLGEILNSLPRNRLVFSVTTDGFLTDATEAEASIAEQNTMGRIFYKSREELTGLGNVLEKKHQVKQLLGWRTRGQATLIPGTSEQEDPSFNTVLARGGISIGDLYDVPGEQSKFITDLFFNRIPGQEVVSDSLTGLRDIVEYDADLVAMKMIKRLNMEYDWKRKPYAIAKHKDYNHISFSTRPWDNVEQFKILREQMTELNKDEIRCLKTEDDFEEIATYVNSRTLVKKVNRTYMKKKESDIDRLRQSLCAAWKHGQAGLSNQTIVVTQAGVVNLSTNEMFAHYLTYRGITTVRYNVEYSKTRGFIPNECPPTKRNREIISKIKQDIPSLDVDLIFASVIDQPLLETVDPKLCPFIQKVIA